MTSVAPPPRRLLPVIDLQRCTGCGWCVPSCPLHLLTLESHGWTKHSTLTSAPDCTGCGRCVPVCPFKAITLAPPAPRAESPFGEG